ncbi:hypothetical protein ABK040_013750 [Willaertia magna]
MPVDLCQEISKVTNYFDIQNITSFCFELFCNQSRLEDRSWWNYYGRHFLDVPESYMIVETFYVIVKDSYEENSVATSKSKCGQTQSSCLPIVYYWELDLKDGYMCYCEDVKLWSIRCDALVYGAIEAQRWIDYIPFNIFYVIESLFVFFILLLPNLFHYDLFKGIRRPILKFNTFIRSLWTGSEKGTLGTDWDEKVGKDNGFKWFSIKHLRTIIILLMNFGLIPYTVTRIAIHASQPFYIYMVQNVFICICYLSLVICFFLIAVLWSNIVLSDKKKGSADVLILPLRITLFIVITIMLLIAIAWALATGFQATNDKVNIAQGIVLVIVIAFFIFIGIALLIFGCKLFYDLTRIRRNNTKVSVLSVKFTKFMFFADVSFLFTDIFFLLQAIRQMTHSAIFSKYYALFSYLFIDVFMLFNYVLLFYILLDMKAIYDVYEFIYWPLFSCCVRKTNSGETKEKEMNNK